MENQFRLKQEKDKIDFTKTSLETVSLEKPSKFSFQNTPYLIPMLSHLKKKEEITNSFIFYWINFYLSLSKIHSFITILFIFISFCFSWFLRDSFSQWESESVSPCYLGSIPKAVPFWLCKRKNKDCLSSLWLKLSSASNEKEKMFLISFQVGIDIYVKKILKKELHFFIFKYWIYFVRILSKFILYYFFFRFYKKFEIHNANS